MSGNSLEELRKGLHKIEFDCKEIENKIREIEGEIQRLERENTIMLELYEIAKEMSKALSFKDMFKIVCYTLQKNFSFDKGFLVTLRSDLDIFQINKIYELSPSLEEELKEVYLPHRVYYKIMESLFYKRGLFYFDGEDKEMINKFNIDIDIPFVISTLKLGKTVIGFLVLENFKKEEFSRFSVFSTQLSLELRRIMLYENVEKMAITDSLTGLYVRRKIIESLELEIERAKKHKFFLTFLMLDIDHFKKCNDRFGHLVGDYVLSEIARILKTNLREIDLIGRYGGEEIAILLLNTKEDEAKIVAERIREKIAHFPFQAYNERFRITVSIGGAVFPKDGDSSLELINHADNALYSAKKQGRNCVIFYGEIKEK